MQRFAAARGVRFLNEVQILALQREGDRIGGARVEGQVLKADAYVVCLGAHSPLLTRKVGVDLSIYPAKGYSATLPVKDASRAFSVSLTDDEYKLVFSRLGERLRIAGTAELNGYDTGLNATRCQALLRRTEELFRAQAISRGRSSGPGCVPRRRRTCPASAPRATRTCSSTPATARSAGPMPAAAGARSPTSSAAGCRKSISPSAQDAPD